MREGNFCHYCGHVRGVHGESGSCRVVSCVCSGYGRCDLTETVNTYPLTINIIFPILMTGFAVLAVPFGMYMGVVSLLNGGWLGSLVAFGLAGFYGILTGGSWFTWREIRVPDGGPIILVSLIGKSTTISPQNVTLITVCDDESTTPAIRLTHAEGTDVIYGLGNERAVEFIATLKELNPNIGTMNERLLSRKT